MSAFKIMGEKRALEFELSDGSAWSVPTMKSLPVTEARELIRKFKDADEYGATDIVIGFFAEKCPGLVERLTMAEMEQVISLWNESSRESLGE